MMKAEIERRAELWAKAETDPKFQKELIERYRFDMLAWIDDWCWGRDPRRLAKKLNPIIPFTLYPRQREFLIWMDERIDNQESGIVLKNRDAGLSYLSVFKLAHGLIFEPNFAGLIASLTEAQTDRLGDPSTLFAKLRDTLSWLPSFMTKGIVSDYSMKIINTSNGASVVGSASKSFGRGSRVSVAFADESAHWDNLQGSMAAISQTCDSTFWVSTPLGFNDFHKLWNQELGEIPTFRFSYLDDPRKNILDEYGNNLWLEKKRRELPANVFAQEILASFDLTNLDSLIPYQWLESCVNFEIPDRITGPLKAGLDLAISGDNNALAFSRANIVLRALKLPSGSLGETASRSHILVERERADLLGYDEIGIGAGFYDLMRPKAKNYSLRPINFAGKSLLKICANTRAELWWKVREMARKTHEYKTLGIVYPASEMLSLPDDRELLEQLASPRVEQNSKGLILIESKKSMKERGVKSPDMAEAVIYSLFADRVTGLWVPQKVRWSAA